MKKLNVYLSGCVRNADIGFQDWRERCASYQEYESYPFLNFIDPIKYFNYDDKQPKTDKQCMDLFMWQIERSDILLVNLDDSKYSCGCSMEIEHAYCKGIPIIAFGNNQGTWYNWAKLRASVVFQHLFEAINYIDEYYAESILN